MRSKRRLRGGAAIGEGSFGCVFRPSLVTASNAAQSINYVSKLMLPEQAQQELNEVSTLGLRDVPGVDDFAVLPLPTIERGVVITQSDTLNLSAKCSGFSNLAKTLGRNGAQQLANERVVLRSVYGGDSIQSLLDGPLRRMSGTQFVRLNSSLIKLLERGLQTLINTRVVHFDVKPDNVVITEQGVSRLIDFGWAFRTTRVDWWDEDKMLRQIVNFNLPMTIPVVELFSTKPKSRKLRIQVPAGMDERTWKPAAAAFIVGLCLTKYNVTDRDGSKLLFSVKSVLGELNEDNLVDTQQFALKFMDDVSTAIGKAKWKPPRTSNEVKTLAFNAFKNVSSTLLCGILVKQMYAVVKHFGFLDGERVVRLDLNQYFDIIRQNADVYGLMSIYAKMLPCVRGGENDQTLMTALSTAVYDYMFSSYFVTRPYDIATLATRLKGLNVLATSRHTLQLPPPRQKQLQINQDVVNAIAYLDIRYG